MRKFIAGAASSILLIGLLSATPVSAGLRGPTITRAPGTRAPSLVTGIDAVPRRGEPEAVARSYLAAHPSTYGIEQARDLQLLRVNEGGDGTLVRFAQVEHGVEVFGAQYVLTLRDTSDGYSVRRANGHLFTDLRVSTAPRYSERAARRLADYRVRARAEVTQTERHGLTILPDGAGRLTYHFTMSGRKPNAMLVKYEVFIDAHTGDIAFMYDNLQREVDGTVGSKDSHGVERPTNYVQTDDGGQDMRDRQREMFVSDGGEITTHRASGDTYAATEGNLISRACCGPFKNRSAVDAHWGAGETYEFFRALGRNSIDDNGMDIVSTVNFSEFPGEPNCNAFWDGSQMVYGDCFRDRKETFAMSADLDVVAHELTHGVMQYTANLVYANQSGAMNEAYSDYFGNALDNNVNNPDLGDETSGYIGEDICRGVPPPPPVETDSGWTCPLRDLNDGRTIADYVYYLIDTDGGGVHLNSTIYGGALWDFRESLYAADGQAGSDRADQYVLDALETMTPLDGFVDGRNVLEATIEGADLPTEAADLAAATGAFDNKGIVDGWDTGSPTDATVLVEDVHPTGFFLAGPQVGGDRFVIGDYEDKTQTFGYVKHVFVGNTSAPVDYRRISPEDPETTTNELPDISGDQAVWVTVSPKGRNNFDFDVVGRNVNGGDVAMVGGGRGLQSHPSIDGDLVAWQKGFDDIYARKLGGRVRKITGKGQQMRPQVTGKWIVYQHLTATGGTGIGMYNWRTKRSVLIKGEGPAYFGPPGVGPGYVYWFNDAKFQDGQGGISSAQLGSRKVETVVGQRNGPYFGFYSEELIPSANEGWVAYLDESRASGAPGSNVPPDQIGRDVYVVPVTGGTPSLITINRGEQVLPAMLPGNSSLGVWLDSSRAQTDLMRN